MLSAGINDFPFVSGADIRAALPTLKAAGVPYYVHAELALDKGAKGAVSACLHHRCTATCFPIRKFAAVSYMPAAKSWQKSICWVS